jgi:glycosyltransferase involved in cell wall biosynthesis
MAEMRERQMVAYLLKGYPRLSEIFIASEIERLERTGLSLRLFVIKPPDEPPRHPVAGRIRARPDYLPAVTTVSGTPALRWLAANLRPFLGPLSRVARRRPLGLARAAVAAAAQSVRAREARLAWPRKVYMKELLLAVALADRLLDDPRVEHLHAHFAHGSTTVAWLASLATGLPFSFTGHAKDVYSEALNPAGLLARKLRAASFAVTCTEAGRERLERLAGATPVHRVYHGLNSDFARLVARPSARPAANGALRVLAVGRLVRKKGFDVLVEASAALRRREIGIEATIAGERGAHADEVERLIASLGLGGLVRLAGPMGQAELHRAYLDADVLCLPCRVLDDGDRDGIPNVLVEAMACGLPVVTTPVAGIPELVRDAYNGLLVAPDDPEAVAGALLRLRRDPALGARLGRAGRQTVRERFDGECQARRLASLFRGALA